MSTCTHHHSSANTARAGRRVSRNHLAQALLLALLAGGAHAATFNAGSEAELIQAINNANANSGADRIKLRADVTLHAALPAITDALTIEGSGWLRKIRRDDSGANACSPTAANAFRLLDASADLTLLNLALSGGCNLVDQGGAVRVQGAALRIARSVVSGNQTFVENTAYAYGQGGIGAGVAVLYGSATLTDSVVSGNSSHGNLAGGAGVAAYASDLTLVRSLITGNRSNGPGPLGGGVYAVFNNAISITDSAVIDNGADGESASGGGLYGYHTALTVSGSWFTGNHVTSSTYGHGGGISIANAAGSTEQVSIDRTTIAANAVSSNGEGAGGIFAAGGAGFRLSASSVIGNTTTTSVFGRGGGIDFEIVPAVIIDSTISGNTMNGPDSRGGGVLILSEGDAPTSLSVFNSTIADNTINGDDSRGGGVRFQSYGDPGASVPPTGLFESTLIAGNVAASGSAVQIEDSPDVAANHSLIQGTIDINPDQGGAFTPDATTSLLMGQDPLLRPLAWNGGPTFTQALRCGGPAIDAGSNVTGLQWDQRGRGFPRKTGTAADIGAVEARCQH
jgi:hypothetical protein